MFSCHLTLIWLLLHPQADSVQSPSHFQFQFLCMPVTTTHRAGPASTAEPYYNLIITVTCGPKVCGCNREVAALQRRKCIQSYYLGLELGSCNNEAALKSDHYTEGFHCVYYHMCCMTHYLYRGRHATCKLRMS